MESVRGEFTAKEIADNHEVFIERLILYKKFGVDRELMRAVFVDQIDGNNGSILEIGTGKGDLTTMLARSAEAVVSVDTDPEGQRLARLNAAHYGVLDKITFITDDAATLHFPDGSFDAVVSAFTFHHLENPFRVIREMIRVAGKQIVISDFNEKGFAAIDRIHASQGRIHDRGTGDFSVVGLFLDEHGCSTSMINDTLQTLYSARLTNKR